MFGKKKNEGGWGSYDGKSRKSSSWGNEIRSGWDTAGADVSLSFTPGADKDTDVFGGTRADWAEESHIGSVEA